MNKEIREKTINGVVFETYWHSFTDSEKATITSCLPRKQFIKIQTEKAMGEFPEIPENNLETVINEAFESCSSLFFTEVEGHCNRFLWWKATPGITTHREALQDMQKSFRIAMKHLKKISTNKLSIPVERSIALSSENFISNLVRQNTIEKAIAVSDTLESLCATIDCYEEKKKERGAPGRATTAFVFEIAKSYRIAFGMMPTAYKMGNFTKVFDAVMCIVSPKNELGDYSRAIKNAINSLDRVTF